jgi:predicted flap endonuclease-1-like 5' DNA nuclease
VVQAAQDIEIPPSAADTTAQRAAATSEQPLVSDSAMKAGAPVEPVITPPASQPYATDYGSPVEGGTEDAGAANIFEMRTPEVKAVVPDDLAILEGIGPRVKEVLAAAGIYTFAELAAADVNHLRQILEGANLRFIDPGTWPEQAKMAADGRMDDLQAFTASLRGGRKVGAG